MVNLIDQSIESYLKLQTPRMHRQFFQTLSKKPYYVNTQYNDRNNSFRFACPKW